MISIHVTSFIQGTYDFGDHSSDYGCNSCHRYNKFHTPNVLHWIFVAQMDWYSHACKTKVKLDTIHLHTVTQTVVNFVQIFSVDENLSRYYWKYSWVDENLSISISIKCIICLYDWLFEIYFSTSWICLSVITAQHFTYTISSIVSAVLKNAMLTIVILLLLHVPFPYRFCYVIWYNVTCFRLTCKPHLSLKLL